MNGGGRGDKDKNKQLKALWHAAKTAWRLFAVENWGLLLWLITGRPGGRGCLPRLLTHNPLQTPQLFSNPLWLTTPLSEREEDLFICCCCLHPSCVSLLVYMCCLTLGCFTHTKFESDALSVKCINPWEQRTLPFALVLSFHWLGQWMTTHQTVFVSFGSAVWTGMLWFIGLEQKQGNRGNETGRLRRNA